MRIHFHGTAAVITFSLLAGCQTGGFTRPGASLAPKPAASTSTAAISIDGKWQPTDPANKKIYYNEFKSGKFAAYTVDGKATLALGTYSRTEGGVKFKYFSQSRKKEVNADCKLFGSDKMQCAVEGSIVDLERA